MSHTAVELSFAGTAGTWLLRVRVSTRVVGSSKAHSKAGAFQEQDRKGSTRAPGAVG